MAEAEDRTCGRRRKDAQKHPWSVSCTAPCAYAPLRANCPPGAVCLCMLLAHVYIIDSTISHVYVISEGLTRSRSYKSARDTVYCRLSTGLRNGQERRTQDFVRVVHAA